jgi:hypothetical protein
MGERFWNISLSVIIGFIVGWFVLSFSGPFGFNGRNGFLNLFRVLFEGKLFAVIFYPSIILAVWVLIFGIPFVIFFLLSYFILKRSSRQLEDNQISSNRILKRKKVFFILLLIYICYFLVSIYYYQSTQSNLDMAFLEMYNCFMSCPHSDYYYQGNFNDSRYFYSFFHKSKIIEECKSACSNKYWIPFYLEKRDSVNLQINDDDFKECEDLIDNGKSTYDSCILKKLDKYSSIIDLTSRRLTADYEPVKLNLINLNCTNDGANVSVKVLNPPINYGYDTNFELVFVLSDDWGVCDSLICGDMNSFYLESTPNLEQSYFIKYSSPLWFKPKKIGVFWQGQLMDEANC